MKILEVQKVLVETNQLQNKKKNKNAIFHIIKIKVKLNKMVRNEAKSKKIVQETILFSIPGEIRFGRKW